MGEALNVELARALKACLQAYLDNNGQYIGNDQGGAKLCSKFLVLLAEAENEKPEQQTFSKATEEFIRSVTGIDTSYRNWNKFTLNTSISPSDTFRTVYENNSKVFSMVNEKGRRTVLDIFFRDILSRPEFQQCLRIFTEYEITIQTFSEGKRRKLTGTPDYTVGLSQGQDIFCRAPPAECHTIAVEAKVTWSDELMWQCVAGMASLHKSRKDAKKQNVSVWGILSNANIWMFFHIDEESKLWRTNEFFLDLRIYDEEKVLAIYRLMHHIFDCSLKASPASTPASPLRIRPVQSPSSHASAQSGGGIDTTAPVTGLPGGGEQPA